MVRATARLGLATALMLASGCGGGGVSSDMQRAFANANYAEVVLLGRHAVKQGDVAPSVHYYYGVSLVAVGRDHEGFDEIDAAVLGDAGFKEKAAAFLKDAAGHEGVSSGDRARRLRKAHELDPKIDLGKQRFAVAGVYFTERAFAQSAAMYEEAIAAFPGDPQCEHAYARLAQCYTLLGDGEKARQALETLVATYPHSKEGQGAASNLNDIMFSEAQTHLDAGEYDEAIEIAGELVGRSDNRSLQQKSRFLLGQAYEGKGDRTAAYDAYRELIRSDRGDSGQIMERARARIEALQEAGLK
jgi:tetratricopeptide (TPR) repeat protein